MVTMNDIDRVIADDQSRKRDVAKRLKQIELDMLYDAFREAGLMIIDIPIKSKA